MKRRRVYSVHSFPEPNEPKSPSCTPSETFLSKNKVKTNIMFCFTPQKYVSSHRDDVVFHSPHTSKMGRVQTAERMSWERCCGRLSQSRVPKSAPYFNTALLRSHALLRVFPNRKCASCGAKRLHRERYAGARLPVIGGGVVAHHKKINMTPYADYISSYHRILCTSWVR